MQKKFSMSYFCVLYGTSPCNNRSTYPCSQINPERQDPPGFWGGGGGGWSFSAREMPSGRLLPHGDFSFFPLAPEFRGDMKGGEISDIFLRE